MSKMILEYKSTMMNSGTIWKHLVIFAKHRDWFYNSSEVKTWFKLPKILNLVELDQLDSLLNLDLFIHISEGPLFFKRYQTCYCRYKP